MATTYKYVLTIGTTDFEINTSSSEENPAIQATLKKLTYNKGVYRPGEIFAVFNVPSSYTYAQIKNLFYEEEENDYRLEASLWLKDGDNKVPIAQNYHVHKMKPIFRRSSSNTMQTVELTICSDDKLMTLDKYCKAYTGKKLGSKIFTEDVERFKIIKKNFPNEKDTNGNTVEKVTYTKETVSTNAKTVGDSLQIISFDDSKLENNETVTFRNEFIQPYLVQYNESFYDFLKRTANRCGEFLYHEKGKLHLGMTTSDKTNTDYATIASEYYYEDIQQGDLAVNDFARNYLDSAPSSPTGLDYDDPLASDEYLSQITKEYTTYSAQMYKHDKDALAYLCSALQGSNLAEIFGALSFQATFQAINAAVLTKTQNDTHNMANIEPWENKKEQWDGKEEKLRQFGTGTNQKTNISTGNDTHNLLAEYYDLIRQLQQKACKNAVFLDFKDNPQDLKIGDLIKVDSTVFLVIEVKGSEEYVDGRYEMHQKVVGIQPYKKSDGNYIPIPPRLPDLIVRESQAQPATVVANFDPKKIGRVRIRFAWQNGTDDASPWIRVALPFATNGGGVKFKPEIGDEVMVSFIDGNVERPYVTGFLLNPNSNENWKALPDRSITSKNGHNITFTDGLDGSNFILNMVPVAGLIKSFIPITDCPALFNSKGGLALTGGTVISDRYKLYEINMSTDNRSILIKSAMGDVTLNAFTGITISAPNGNINIAGKNVNISASNKVNITSGSAIRKRFFPDSGLGDHEDIEKKFGYSTAFTFSDFFLSGFDTYAQKLANKFIDLTFIRTIIEVFTRPIDGTTKIKSFTSIQIEAGKGSTDITSGTVDKKDQPYVPDFVTAVDYILSAVNARIYDIYAKYKDLFIAIEAFKAISGENENAVNKNQEAISFKTIRTDGTGGKKSYKGSEITWPERLQSGVFDADAAEKKVKEAMKHQTRDECDHKPEESDARYQVDGKFDKGIFNLDISLWDYYWDKFYMGGIDKVILDNQTKTQNCNEILQKANALLTAFADLNSAIDKATNDVNTKLRFCGEINTAVKETFDELKLPKAEEINEEDSLQGIETNFGIKLAIAKKKWKRKAVWKMLAKIKNREDLQGFTFKINNYNKASDVMGNWDVQVNSLTIIYDSDFLKSWGSRVVNTAVNEWKTWYQSSVKSPWVSAFSNITQWGTGAKSQILLSNDPNKSYKIEDGEIKNAATLTVSEKYIEGFKNKLKNIE